MADPSTRDGLAVGKPGRVSSAVPHQFTAGDALRGIAAMFVLVFHAAIETLLWKHGHGLAVIEESPSQLRPVVGGLAPEMMIMHGGIYIFFALSGYLLTRTFLAAYTLGTPRPSITRYFRNRALRIIPAFWVVITLYVLWDHAENAGGIGGLAAVYGFAQNYHWTPVAYVIPQAWTLDIEIAFYILIPLASLLALAAARKMKTTPAQRLAIVLTVLLAAYVLSLISKHRAGSPINLTYNIANFLFAFIPGVALAAVEPFAAPRLRNASNGRVWAWGFLALYIALLGAYVSLPASERNLHLIFISLGCGGLVGAALTLQWATGGCWRVFDNHVMCWLGARSYGIYLIHLGLMGHVLAGIGHSHGTKGTFVLLLIGATICTLIGADLLWRFVEQPALQRRLPWRQAEFAHHSPGGEAEER